MDFTRTFWKLRAKDRIESLKFHWSFEYPISHASTEKDGEEKEDGGGEKEGRGEEGEQEEEEEARTGRILTLTGRACWPRLAVYLTALGKQAVQEKNIFGMSRGLFHIEACDTSTPILTDSMTARHSYSAFLCLSRPVQRQSPHRLLRVRNDILHSQIMVTTLNPLSRRALCKSRF